MTERHVIARGHAANTRRSVTVVSLLITGWMASMMLLWYLRPGKVGQTVMLGLFGLVVSAIIMFVMSLHRRGSALVGNDGIYVDSLDDRRFIPFCELAEVAPYASGASKGVALTLHDGESYLLNVDSLTIEAADRVQRLVEDIENAMQAYRVTSKMGKPATEVLQRGQRDMAHWVSQLRGVGEGLGAPRRAAIPAEHLWQTVEDPTVAASDRAGAAVALSARLDEAAVGRLRVAIKNTAAPKLRIALEQSLRDDDDALLDALSALEVQ